MRFKLITAAIFLFTLFNDSKACQCDFEKPSIIKFNNYDEIYHGKIISREIVKGVLQTESDPEFIEFEKSIEYYKYTIEVINIIKASKQSEMIIFYSNTQQSACGVTYAVNEELYLFLYGINSLLFTNSCAQNLKTKYATSEYLELIKDYRNENQTEWFNSEGIKIAEGKILNTLPVGNWKYYFTKNNSSKSEGKFINGATSGLWKNYHSDGSLKSQGSYLNNKKNGNWNYYLNEKKSKRKLKSLSKSKILEIENPNNILNRIVEYKYGKYLNEISIH